MRLNSEPRELRAWTRLPSGRHLDLITPDPNAWTDSDLATRLARTPRWSGESCWPLPLSVAQHSLTVLALARQAPHAMHSPARLLRELLHDADEGLIGWDCVGPLKPALGEPFRLVSERLMHAIETRYSLPGWTLWEYQEHKLGDVATAAAEAVHCVGWSPQEVREILGIDAEILDVDPLSILYDCEPWKPWEPDAAAECFLAEMHALIRERDAAL